jgi:hypothetical protein
VYQRQIEEECAGNFDESVCLQEGKSVTQLVHRGQQLWLADSVLHVSFAWPRHYRRCLQEHATDVLSVEGSVDFGIAKAWCYAGNSNAVNETSPTVLVEDTICEHLHLEPIQARDAFGSDLPTSALCATRDPVTGNFQSEIYPILQKGLPGFASSPGAFRTTARYCEKA